MCMPVFVIFIKKYEYKYDPVFPTHISCCRAGSNPKSELRYKWHIRGFCSIESRSKWIKRSTLVIAFMLLYTCVFTVTESFKPPLTLFVRGEMKKQWDDAAWSVCEYLQRVQAEASLRWTVRPHPGITWCAAHLQLTKSHWILSLTRERASSVCCSSVVFVITEEHRCW